MARTVCEDAGSPSDVHTAAAFRAVNAPGLVPWQVGSARSSQTLEQTLDAGPGCRAAPLLGAATAPLYKQAGAVL
jgi:hypothetical protein